MYCLLYTFRNMFPMPSLVVKVQLQLLNKSFFFLFSFSVSFASFVVSRRVASRASTRGTESESVVEVRGKSFAS